jgi:parvulin-like peptidyl-prolyl isomerase
MKRFLVCTFLSTVTLVAQSALAAEPDVTTVVATVGDDPITVEDVQRIMDAIPANKKPTGDLLPTARALALEEVVNRWLVIAYAKRVGDVPSDEELAKAKKVLQLRTAARGRKAANGAQADAVTESELEQQVLWRLVWDRYLAKYRTPEHRKIWFASHHREVDGTELVVSHILLRPAAGAGPKDWEELEKQAVAIRAEIASGKLDFVQAATKYSAGPSGKQGGRLGKIGRRGPMDESFSRAAFALEAGQISSPVQTRFGVHLIRCDDVVPGNKQIGDVKETIDDALAKELLDKLSTLERAKTPVKYGDAWPHFKPGTQELVK